jgi:hypothetical protein
MYSNSLRIEYRQKIFFKQQVFCKIFYERIKNILGFYKIFQYLVSIILYKALQHLLLLIIKRINRNSKK